MITSGIVPLEGAFQVYSNSIQGKKMLVLSRYRDESIYIGDDVVITVVDIRGDRVRIGVQAPPDVSVHRQEVYEAIKSGKHRLPDSGSRGLENQKSSLTPSVAKPGSAPLSQELSKQKAKKAYEAKDLPINVDTPAEFGGLTSDSNMIS